MSFNRTGISVAKSETRHGWSCQSPSKRRQKPRGIGTASAWVAENDKEDDGETNTENPEEDLERHRDRSAINKDPSTWSVRAALIHRVPTLGSSVQGAVQNE